MKGEQFTMQRMILRHVKSYVKKGAHSIYDAPKLKTQRKFKLRLR